MADIKRSKDDKKLLDSRPYTGIDFGFLTLYGNQHKIHNLFHESTLDSHQHVFSLPEINGTCHIQREPVLSRTLTFKLINV